MWRKGEERKGLREGRERVYRWGVNERKEGDGRNCMFTCTLTCIHAHTRHVYFHKPVVQRGVYIYIHMHV